MKEMLNIMKNREKVKAVYSLDAITKRQKTQPHEIHEAAMDRAEKKGWIKLAEEGTLG